MYNNVNSFINNIGRDLLEQQEAIILEQLNDLIKDGVLVIQKTQPVITMSHKYDSDKYEVTISEAVKLSYIGKEKMDELQTENTKLKEEVRLLKAGFLDQWILLKNK